LLTAATLTATLLAATLLAATLLTTALFFLLAPLTFTLFPIAILLSALSRFLWILLCTHDAFLCCWI
jgi:hypothetical protein